MMSTVAAETTSQYAITARHLIAAKMYSLASCVMIFYDIMITFGDEVEKIWKSRFTGATALWLINRYLLPLGYIVIIISFHDSKWSPSVCERYILYPELLKIFATTAIGAIFILRLYAIYSRSRYILVGFTTLLIVEIVVKVWAFCDGIRLHLPPGLVGCILTGKHQPRYVWTWIAELIFDSCVFFATLYKGFDLYRQLADGTTLMLVRIMIRDGVLYFATIFASNLVTVLFFMVATPDLKAINASFSTLVTSLMVSRLMLNLRVRTSADRSPRWPTTRDYSRVGLSFTVTTTATAKDNFIDTVIGNLGEPVDSYWIDSDISGSSDSEIDVVHRDVELTRMSRERHAIRTNHA